MATNPITKAWRWVAYHLVGFILSIPIVFTIAVLKLFQIITGKVPIVPLDWDQVDAPESILLPQLNLTQDWIVVEQNVKIHCVFSQDQKPEKPLVVFVHGFPEAWYSWRHQIKALVHSHDIVAFDMRGYGSSSCPERVDACMMDHIVDDLERVVNHFRKENKAVYLVAHDWGGVVAWHFAHLHQELVSKLVIIAAPHPLCYTNVDLPQLAKSWYIFVFLMPLLPEYLLTAGNCDAIEKMFRPLVIAGHAKAEEVVWYKRNIGRDGRATCMVNYYRALVSYATIKPSLRLGQALKQTLRVPTLVLQGENDRALGLRLLHGIERHVDRIRVIILEGAGHWLQQERSEEVNDHISRFLG